VQAWHVLEPSTPFVSGIHAEAICAHLQAAAEGRVSNLIINVPPGHQIPLGGGLLASLGLDRQSPDRPAVYRRRTAGTGGTPLPGNAAGRDSSVRDIGWRNTRSRVWYGAWWIQIGAEKAPDQMTPAARARLLPGCSRAQRPLADRLAEPPSITSREDELSGTRYCPGQSAFASVISTRGVETIYGEGIESCEGR
jgi:hypothetical protein